MTSLTEQLPSNYKEISEDLPMTSIIKHAQDHSLVSLAQNFASQISKRQDNYQKFSASLLKNKTLLVPTRLALKRQRAAFKNPTLQYEPIRSETFQIELGNPTHIKTSQLRGKTAHTLPTDISLLYREKPSFIHPITGNFMAEYAEDDGSPSPCSYVLPRQSCREKNAPAYTFGTRCLVEKKGGSRTAWQKQWFAHSNPFTTKVDFNRENVWPTPFHYPAQPTLGSQSTKVSFPSWSIATRLHTSPILAPDNNPSPDTYDTTTAFRKLTAKSTPITLKSRIGGTQMSLNQSADITPGPGAHNERKFFSNKPSSPKHSFGKRIPASLCQDPYVNVLPSFRISSNYSSK